MKLSVLLLLLCPIRTQTLRGCSRGFQENNSKHDLSRVNLTPLMIQQIKIMHPELQDMNLLVP